MKLKHWLRYLVTHDTTWHGEFKALRPLLIPAKEVERVVVDVGANDGFYSSNSYPFIRRGWRAVLIEPHPGAFARASKLHAGNGKVVVLNLACGNKPEKMPLLLFEGDDGGSQSTLSTHEGQVHTDRAISRRMVVEVESLEKILDQQRVPLAFGLLSVDSEGHDYQIIQGLNLAKYQPRVIITEDCPKRELKFHYLVKHGYHLHQRLQADTIWTRFPVTAALTGG
jgi:FkbM family methyltransferase